MDIFESWLVNNYICKNGLTSESMPENTIGAFEEAVKNKYATMITVQMISDDTIICFSDMNLARMTKQNGYTVNLTKDDLLKMKIVGTEYCIPTLDEALKEINGKVPVLINILNENAIIKLGPTIMKVLSKYKGEYAVMSNNPLTVQWFRDNAPNVVRGIKSCHFKAKNLGAFRTSKLKKLKYNKICDPQFIVYNAVHLPNRHVKKYKDLPLLAWGVTSLERYLQLAPHCDNIIFNGFTPKI